MKYKHIILTALVFTFGFINLTNAGWEISVGEEDEGVIVNFKTFRPNVDNLYEVLDGNVVLGALKESQSEIISFNNIKSKPSLNAVKAFLKEIPEGYFAPCSALEFNFAGTHEGVDSLSAVVKMLRKKAKAPEDADELSGGDGSGSDSDTNDYY